MTLPANVVRENTQGKKKISIRYCLASLLGETGMRDRLFHFSNASEFRTTAVQILN
jgi:hypothetical protein